jgi:hypothetical protein
MSLVRDVTLQAIKIKKAPTLQHRSLNTTTKRNHHESKEDGYIIISPFFRFVKPYRKEDFLWLKKVTGAEPTV